MLRRMEEQQAPGAARTHINKDSGGLVATPSSIKFKVICEITYILILCEKRHSERHDMYSTNKQQYKNFQSRYASSRLYYKGWCCQIAIFWTDINSATVTCRQERSSQFLQSNQMIKAKNQLTKIPPAHADGFRSAWTLLWHARRDDGSSEKNQRMAHGRNNRGCAVIKSKGAQC